MKLNNNRWQQKGNKKKLKAFLGKITKIQPVSKQNGFDVE